MRVFVFAILLIAAGSATWSWMLQQEVLRLTADLEHSKQRVSDLETVLSTTGANITESANNMQSKIELLLSEVDKLWASAWRRNKADIDEHGKAIEELKGGVAGVAANKKRLDQLVKADEEIKSQLDAAKKAATALEEIRTQQGLQEAMIGRLNRELDNVASKQAGVDKRLREAEDWVQSNLEFRKQTLQRLNRLDGGVVPAQ